MKSDNNYNDESQRKKLKMPEREAANEIDGPWFQNYYQVVYFGHLHGHLDIPLDECIEDGANKYYIGKWLQSQKSPFLHSITEEKLNLLLDLMESFGLCWGAEDTRNTENNTAKSSNARPPPQIIRDPTNVSGELIITLELIRW